MDKDIFITPRTKVDIPRIQRTRRFARKPLQKSERSSSKKSYDSSVKQMYIKSPTNMKREKSKQGDFFTTLASSLITSTAQTYKKQSNLARYKNQFSQRGQDHLSSQRQTYNEFDSDKTNNKANYRVSALQAEIQLKNHQIIILSGEIQRLKSFIDEDKQKKKKIQTQKKQLARQLKQIAKGLENTKIQVKKLEKQKQHLLKQIQFLERINYDEKTRTLQSYREKYLQTQLQNLKKQLQKSKGQRQQMLQYHLQTLKQQKFTIQSHYKAMKVANQCLIKQINHTQQNIHDIILNSEQYKKLRDKYIRFLEQYKLLRNEYWALKAQIKNNQKLSMDDSSFGFSITASQVQEDLSLLKNSPSNTNLLPFSSIAPKQAKSKSSGAWKQQQNQNEPTYSFRPKVQ